MKRDPHDEALLEHYRRHSDEQPPAELDARILAAAKAAAQSNRRPGWRERLLHWLSASGHQHRWGVALASVAVLAVGLSLTQRTFEHAPPAAIPAIAPASSDAPTLRSAPALAPSAPIGDTHLFEEEAQSTEAESAAELGKRRAEARSQGVPALRQEPPAQAAAKADAAAPEPRASLLRLQGLYRDGRDDAAQQLREELQRRYPRLDIDAELRRLQEKP
ncbi:hypothetical protein D9M68_217530 [compost metagenome]|uniref:Uncharacterized protein n=1 Tax=Pseudomonas jinjuensis TaxID=198616 RepID=A0A1H0I8D7_9PSED|nr:hypothetical protein [Pseudomonas jinjuensis]SDO27668.1 hypothetical protein SAMN05216193_109207 [Pseudomonas jinjuensis]